MDRTLYRLLIVAAAADMIVADATMDYRTLLPTDLSGIRSRDAESAVVVAWGLSNYGSLGFPTNATYVCLLYTSPSPRDS